MKSANTDLNSFGLLVAENIPAMLSYWDKNQVCRFANAAYMEWFGKSPHEMIDKITMKKLLGPIYYSNLPYITGVLAGERQTFERTILLPNGSIRHSLANYIPDIENGDVKGYFVHVADITDIKLLENELIRSNETIARQNKRLLDFSRLTSHNLRSPVINLTTILRLYNSTAEEATRKMLFSNFEIVVSHLNTTLNELLESLKIQEDKNNVPELIYFNQILTKTTEILVGEIMETQAVITSNFSDAESIVFPKSYLESIMLNLLSNSIKYRSPARIPEIHFQTNIQNDKTVLTIRDNGLGIDLKKHRNDFFRLHKTFHNNEDAKGVGLFITKAQIETMGGEISVDSEIDKGTTFTIIFSNI